MNDSQRFLYFAYGSNLWTEQMIRRVGAECISVLPKQAFLSGYRLAFNMRGSDGNVYANVMKTGPGVRGIVYTLNEEAMRSLDDFEKGYDRVVLNVTINQDEITPVHVYVSQDANLHEGQQPTDAYLSRILRGATEYFFPAEYIEYIRHASGT